MSASNTLLRVGRRAATAASRRASLAAATTTATRAISINSADKGSGSRITTQTTGDQKLRQTPDDLLGDLRKAPRPRR